MNHHPPDLFLSSTVSLKVLENREFSIMKSVFFSTTVQKGAWTGIMRVQRGLIYMKNTQTDRKK